VLEHSKVCYQSALGDRINYVNASLEAKSRGIHVVEVKDDTSRDFGRWIVASSPQGGPRAATA